MLKAPVKTGAFNLCAAAWACVRPIPTAREAYTVDLTQKPILHLTYFNL